MDLIPSNLFSGDDLQILLPRLWELLGKQTERYTMGDSTSVTVEAAQELLASLWYTITLVMDETHTPYSRLLSDELMPFVKQGQTILQDKLESVKRLWEAVCRTSPEIRNSYFTDTLRGIGDYLRRYDLCYFAHRKPLCIDYPLLNAPSETMHGLTYTEQYLKCMLAELLEMMQNKSKAKQRESLHAAALSVCDQMGITDNWIIDYVTSFSDTLLPRIDAALERMDLSHIFIPSCK